jgi:phosphotransferase system  glucose/maltose/N-acetylglucosamine-specific IIC component
VQKFFDVASGRRVAVFLTVTAGSILSAGFFGTADSNLTSATGDIQSYFTDNIGTVIALVVGISLLVWILRLAFHSVGVRKPRSVD